MTWNTWNPVTATVVAGAAVLGTVWFSAGLVPAGTPDTLGRVRAIAAKVEGEGGIVTGTGVGGWSRTMTVETGILFPWQAKELGDILCEAAARSGPGPHREGWSVVVKGATGVALYRCFV